MMWKERFVSRTSVLTKVTSTVLVTATLCGIGYIVLDSARPAFVELWTYGYGSRGMNQERDEFNRIMRLLATITYILWVLGVASASSSGFTSEREEDTWISLISTPLTAWEVIRAKMLGAVWGLRWLGCLLLTFWVLGLAAGSLHPLAFVAVVLETTAYLWFVTALGTYVSLRSRRSGRALLTTLSFLIFVNGPYLLCCIPIGSTTSFISWAGMTPLMEAGSLMTYDEVQRVFSGESRMRDSFLTGLVSLYAYIFADVILTRALIRRFDIEVDRPRRQMPVSSTREVVYLDEIIGSDNGTVEKPPR